LTQGHGHQSRSGRKTRFAYLLLRVMSIAVSALIRPSRLLRAALALLAIAILFCAGWLFLFAFPTLPPFSRLSLSTPVLLAAIALLISAFRSRKSFHLDISGLGQIRLREHYTGAAAAAFRPSVEREEPGLQDGRVVRLLGDSTLWPSLLALRLCDAGGRCSSLLILPDSVDENAFRALFVALRWIASRELNEEFEGNETRG
jgi:toxin CptA